MGLFRISSFVYRKSFSTPLFMKTIRPLPSTPTRAYNPDSRQDLNARAGRCRISSDVTPFRDRNAPESFPINRFLDPAHPLVSDITLYISALLLDQNRLTCFIWYSPEESDFNMNRQFASTRCESCYRCKMKVGASRRTSGSRSQVPTMIISYGTESKWPPR